jgi:hypothetical protein
MRPGPIADFQIGNECAISCRYVRFTGWGSIEPRNHNLLKLGRASASSKDDEMHFNIYLERTSTSASKDCGGVRYDTDPQLHGVDLERRNRVRVFELHEECVFPSGGLGFEL